MKYLTSKRHSVITPKPGDFVFKEYNYKYVIFVLSSDCRPISPGQMQCIAHLTDCVDKGKVRLIPVLRDMDIDEVPAFLKWVLFFKTTNTDYLKNLDQAVRGILFFNFSYTLFYVRILT